MSDEQEFEPVLLHEFKNHLAIILGFSELLLAELPDDAVRNDVIEIHKAAAAAIALLPRLTPYARE
jgi:hypothetical protein